MKNILITGVSQGIGRTLALHFNTLGFRIYGGYKWSTSYREEEALAESLQKDIPEIVLLPYDLADRQAVSALIEKLQGVQLHAIVHNAAEFLSNSFDTFDPDAWNRSMAVNLTAPLLLTHGLSPNLVDGASVVNVASTDANYAAYDDIGYAASKAGLVNLTKSMAAALAKRNIRVNAILPGWVDTQMAENANISEYAQFQTPLQRNASTEEIANFVEFLVSEKSSFVNAAALVVDGGYSSTDYVIKQESEHSLK